MDTEFVSLVENALDFIDRSIDDLEQGKPKYSVINFYAGLELLMKARLLKEHWALCASDVGGKSKLAFSSGDFNSIGLVDAQKRLSNIIGCSLLESEKEAYERLRKRRNQAVHFFHPDDLKSMKKVAVEQLRGWHFLHKRLTTTWKECFDPFLPCISKMHKRISAREEYYPEVFEELRSEIEKKSKNRLKSHCSTCNQPSAFSLGKLFKDVHRLECSVCNAKNFALFLPCESCGKDAPRSLERTLQCQWCERDQIASVEELFKSSEKTGLLDAIKSWCGVCGYTAKQSVIEIDGSSACLACLTIDEHSTILRCDWCGDYVTGPVGDSINPGCLRCGIHIAGEACEPSTTKTYLNDVSTWAHHRRAISDQHSFH